MVYIWSLCPMQLALGCSCKGNTFNQGPLQECFLLRITWRTVEWQDNSKNWSSPRLCVITPLIFLIASSMFWCRKQRTTEVLLYRVCIDERRIWNIPIAYICLLSLTFSDVQAKITIISGTAKFVGLNLVVHSTRFHINVLYSIYTLLTFYASSDIHATLFTRTYHK